VKGAKAISLDVEDSEALDAEVGKVDGVLYSSKLSEDILTYEQWL